MQWYDYVKGGESFTLIRDRGLGAYYGFEKTLNNNDETALTFTRTHVDNSDSYIDPSTGLLTFAGVVDTPRYPAGKYGHGLLIEGSRANIIVNQSLSHADWTKANITASANATETDDLEDTNTADKLIATAANGTVTLTTATAVSTNDGVFSIDISCASGTVEGEIRITDGSALVVGTTTFTATPEWQRIQAVYTNAGDPSDNWIVIVQIDINTEILFVDYPQLEVGSKRLFASQRIKTAGASVTRNAEKCLGLCANIIGRKQGTIMFWFKPEYARYIVNNWGTGIGTTRMLFHSGADGTNRHVSIGINSSNNWEIRAYRSNGANYASIGGSASQIALDTWIHLCLTYDSTISNGLNWYINGSLISTSTNDAFDASDIGTNFAIGSFIAGGSEAFGVFDEICVRQDVLNASQIKQIANKGYGLGERKNRFTAYLNNPNFNPVAKVGSNRYDLEIIADEVIT